VDFNECDDDDDVATNLLSDVRMLHILIQFLSVKLLYKKIHPAVTFYLCPFVLY
jgi:hypothetical protein